MRLLLLGLVASAALALSVLAVPVLALPVLALPGFEPAAAAATPATKLTITTRLEGGDSPHTYTLTCSPATVQGLQRGALRPLDACGAVALAGAKLYGTRLSRRLEDCNYLVAPRRATITGYRLGRKVRTFVEVGGCEQMLVPLRVLKRFVAWTTED
jgi:hypothetical protein